MQFSAQAELQADSSDSSRNLVFNLEVPFHRDNYALLEAMTGIYHSSDLLALNQRFVKRLSSEQ